MSETIELAPYNPDWPAAYEAEARRVSEACVGVLSRVHHFGSTSVSGLIAKPVIDILGETPDLAAIDACAPALAELGYLARGENGISGRRFFQKRDAKGERSHHLHIFASGAPEIAGHLAFRERLRANAALAADYGALKLEIVARGIERREDYGKPRPTSSSASARLSNRR